MKSYVFPYKHPLTKTTIVVFKLRLFLKVENIYFVHNSLYYHRTLLRMSRVNSEKASSILKTTANFLPKVPSIHHLGDYVTLLV